MHNRFLTYIGCFALLMGMTRCIQPIELDISKQDRSYVVDGLITNQPGPYSVTVKYSGAYTQNFEGTQYGVNGALVILSDDAGNEEILMELGNGIYQTHSLGIQGVAGRSYTLQIFTIDGDTLESYPEVLLETPDVENIYYEFKEASPTNLEGHEVIVRINDPADESNYYRWKWLGMYQFVTIWRRWNPASGVACWREDFDLNQINILSDEYVNGNPFEHAITLVPFFSTGKYLVHVYQQSLTKSAYDFWLALEEQRTRTGTIFEPPPVTIVGNVFCVNNPDKKVLGYFGASEIKRSYIMVRRPSGVDPPYVRTYPFDTRCWELTNSYKVGERDTWPEGWE